MAKKTVTSQTSRAIKAIEKPERRVRFITVHCSDSDYPHHDNVDEIRDWHIKGNGWQDIGYHYVITKQKPYFYKGRDIEVTPAAVKGHNTDSIAICLTGKNKFNKSQFSTLKKLIKHFQKLYEDELLVYHHRDLDFSRTCPNFDMFELDII